MLNPLILSSTYCSLWGFSLRRAMQNNEHFPLRICFMQDNAKELYNGVPNYATEASAGFDLRACIDLPELEIKVGERVTIPSGIAIEPMQDDVAGFVYSRSGLGAKRGLTVAQGVGVIDNDYRGEILVVLLNTSNEDQIIKKGERIAQLIFKKILHAQIEICQSLDDTARGAGGFGHTGKH